MDVGFFHNKTSLEVARSRTRWSNVWDHPRALAREAVPPSGKFHCQVGLCAVIIVGSLAIGVIRAISPGRIQMIASGYSTSTECPHRMEDCR